MLWRLCHVRAIIHHTWRQECDWLMDYLIWYLVKSSAINKKWIDRERERKMIDSVASIFSSLGNQMEIPSRRASNGFSWSFLILYFFQVDIGEGLVACRSAILSVQVFHWSCLHRGCYFYWEFGTNSMMTTDAQSLWSVFRDSSRSRRFYRFFFCRSLLFCSEFKFSIRWF